MIVNVNFKNRYGEGFGPRKYSYYCDLDVKVGDIVKLPTKNGDGVGRVAEIHVDPNRVDDRVLPQLKTITEYAAEEVDA